MRRHWHSSLLPLIALYAGTAAWARPGLSQAILLGLLAVPLIWATLTDLADHVIPDWASLSVAGLGLLGPAVSGGHPDWVTVVVAVVLTGGLALGGEVYWRRRGSEALGLGDAKLIGAGTLVVGAEWVWSLLLIASTGGILAVLLSGRGRREAIPFGPFLAYSVFVVTAFLVDR